MNLERFQNFGIAIPSSRLAPLLAEFESALLDRSSDFLFERCAAIGDFAVARRLRLDGTNSVIEKITLTVQNLDDETKPLQPLLTVTHSFRTDRVSTTLGSGLLVVDLTCDEPFIDAINRASDILAADASSLFLALSQVQAHRFNGRI